MLIKYRCPVCGRHEEVDCYYSQVLKDYVPYSDYDEVCSYCFNTMNKE
jgi:hypothetical protein